jgi:hypothetical protein
MPKIQKPANIDFAGFEFILSTFARASADECGD